MGSARSRSVISRFTPMRHSPGVAFSLEIRSTSSASPTRPITPRLELPTSLRAQAKQSIGVEPQSGLLRRGVYHRAGRRPDPLAPRHDGGDVWITPSQRSVDI